jgi:hypothetical protein
MIGAGRIDVADITNLDNKLQELHEYKDQYGDMPMEDNTYYRYKGDSNAPIVNQNQS